MLNIEKIQELLGNEYTCETFTERKNNITLQRVTIRKHGTDAGVCLNFSAQFETENELVDFFLDYQNKSELLGNKLPSFLLQPPQLG